MTNTKIQVQITQWDDDQVVTRGGCFDSMESFSNHIENRVRLENVISIEFTKNLVINA
tara:strand:- start:205 stop:378 length:174 start_codon:yes stop_codon:yes gene_type:complete